MALLFLEALGALVLLLFIVWWTMFSGRKNGELPSEPDETPGATPENAPDAAPRAAAADDARDKPEKNAPR
jgi:hypothetical protein